MKRMIVASINTDDLREIEYDIIDKLGLHFEPQPNATVALADDKGNWLEIDREDWDETETKLAEEALSETEFATKFKAYIQKLCRKYGF